MPNLKISELPLASLPLNADDLFAVVQTGTTSQIPFSGITYSSVKVGVQEDSGGDINSPNLLDTSNNVTQGTINTSGNAPVFITATVQYEVVTGAVADVKFDLRKDGSPVGPSYWADVTAGVKMMTINYLDVGAAGQLPTTYVYDLYVTLDNAAEVNTYSVSLSLIEL